MVAILTDRTMTEQSYTINIGQSKLLNLDTDEFGNYIAISKSKEIITASYKLTISRKFRFPIIRWLIHGRFLIADARCDKSNNAVIYDKDGRELKSFYAGDGIEDILILQDKIIFTYFDEGVFGNDGPNNEGLTVFNFDGKQLFGFNSASDGLIADCYSMCKFDSHKILFYTYTDFPVIELNIDTFKWKVHQTSTEYAGANSMVCKYGQVIFHGTYSDKKSFFLWDIWQKKVKKIGVYSARLRGIENGKFLSVGKNGFTIIDPLDE